MSSEYEKGYRGEIGTNDDEYRQGQLDRAAGVAMRAEPATGTDWMPTAVSRPMDTSRVTSAGRSLGLQWRLHPDRTLKRMLVELVINTFVAGLIGFAVGLWLHDSGLWFVYAKVWFWFVSFMIVSGILGVTMVGAGTLRGTLTMLFLGGVVAWMTWTYVLYPVVFIHIK